MTPRPIWIDTDPGFDDLVTLALAAHHPADLALVGVSVVAGNAPLERTLHNALIVAETFGISAPIYAGCAQPLVRPSVTAENVLGAGAFGTLGARLPEPTIAASDGHGALRLLEAALRPAAVGRHHESLVVEDGELALQRVDHRLRVVRHVGGHCRSFVGYALAR